MSAPLDRDATAALIERFRAMRSAEADLDKEVRALLDRRREAISEQHAALDRLAAAGVPLTVVTHRAAMLDQRVLDVAQRQREAARLRQRRRRSRVTTRHADPAAPTPRAGSPWLPSSETTAAAQGGEEQTMPVLVKKTIVEHYELDPLEDEVVTDDLDEDDEDEEQEEDESEKKRSRRSPRTKC